MVDFPIIEECISKNLKTSEECIEGSVVPRVVELNNQVNFAAIPGAVTLNSIKDGRCGLWPTFKHKWGLDTVIGKGFILENQRHRNSGKAKWICGFHHEALLN